MRQLYENDVVMTYEANGIPPIVEWLVCEYYMQPGSLLSYLNGILRQHIFASLLPQLNQKGAELYQNDSGVREAARRFRAHGVELERMCSDLLAADTVTSRDIETLLALSGACFKDYEFFDAWYTEGAYAYRDNPDTSAALAYAEREKNVLRAEFGELFFEPSKNFLAVLRRAAEQLGVSTDDISWYFGPELKRAFEGVPLTLGEMQARRKAFVYLHDSDGTTSMLTGDDADNYITTFEGAESASAPHELVGQCANRGKIVRGMVRVINSDYIDFSTTQAKMDAMKEGDILVSPTTAPDLMPALRKAAAIVTDVGGMLSHAALVARELNKPCVVGTKTASRIFKDGDLVEVEADNGIVRKI